MLEFWTEGGKSRERLLTGALLRESDGQLKEHADTLSNDERALISVSVAADRRWRLLRNIGAASIAIVLSVGAIFLLLQTRLADQQQTIAFARKLTAMAEQERNKESSELSGWGGLELSVVLAAEAVQRLDTTGVHAVDADLALRRGLALLPRRLAHFDFSGPLEAVAFTSNGQLSAAGKDAITTVLGDPANGQILSSQEGKEYASELQLSPNGRFIATVPRDGDRGELDVWEAGSRKFLRRVNGVGKNIADFAISADGQYVVLTTNTYDNVKNTWDNGQTQIIELATNTELARLPSAASLPSFSLDGRYLAATADDKARLWSWFSGGAANLQEIQIFPPDLGGRVVFSPDGTHIGVVSDETFRVWDLDSRKMVAECKCGVVQALSSDGRYVAAFEYQTPSARVLDTANGNEMARITGGGIIFAGAFSSKDSNLALVTLNGADVWEAPAGKSTLTIIRSGPDAIHTEFGENEEHLITLIRSANGLSASKWQSLSGQNISSIALNDASEPVTVSADHRYIATAAPGGIRRLDITNGEQRSLNYKGAATAIALSPDGLFVSVAIDRKISLTAFESSSQEQVQLTAPGTVRLLAVGDGGKLVVAVSIGRAERAGDPVFGTLWQSPSWDPKTFRVGRDLSGFDAQVCGLSLDGQYVAVNFGDKIGIQDVKDGHRVVNFFGAVGDLCAFSSDGRLFASSSGDAIHLWI